MDRFEEITQDVAQKNKKKMENINEIKRLGRQNEIDQCMS